jgi:hypothetical protein
MFVNEAVLLPASLTDAKKRLRDFVDSAGDLQATSSAAFTYGARLLALDGESASPPAIVVQNLPPYARGDTDVVSLRWRIRGDSAENRAPLDANLELSPATDGLSQLALIGSYRPPQPQHAPPLDLASVDAAARATCRTFVTSVADIIAPPGLGID